MALKMRTGIEENFDANKMVPGEWAVSTDTKYVRMCFAPGIVARMATYEAFEQDMLEIQTILASCQDIKTAVSKFEELAEQHAALAETYSITSKSWAVGGTGKRDGEDTNNSKYFSQQSKIEADRAKTEADRAASIANFDIDTGLSNTSTNPVQNKVITAELEKKLENDGDASDTTVSFEQAKERTDLHTGDKLSILVGKIAKFFSDIKSVAFTGKYTDLSGKPELKAVATSGDYNDLENKPAIPSLSNNLLTTVAGTALDAMQGKVLDDKITELNTSLSNNGIGISGYLGVNIGSKFSGSAAYIKKNGFAILTFELTPISSIEHGDIVAYNLPLPHFSMYGSLPGIKANCPIMINTDGTITVYYPSTTDVGRIDCTLIYPHA